VKRIFGALGSLLFLTPSATFAQERVDLLPPSAFDRSIIYLDLALFWMALIVLVVLIRLKLREIERIQAMEKSAGDEETPMLD
jgi:hypothetical protein